MTYHKLFLTTVAALGLGAAAAAADCSAELAQLTGEGGVAKDGSMAPLEGTAPATPQVGGDAAAASDETSEGVAKDGTGEPLGADESLAMSEQDVAAQQSGGATAAEQAAGASGGGDRDAVLARAQEALDAGDEAACMEAVEEAKSM